MNATLRFGIWLGLLAATIAFSSGIEARADSHAPGETSASDAPASDADADRAHFQELVAERALLLAEANALAMDLTSATGGDQAALGDRALVLRRESVKLLEEMGTAIEALELRGQDASAELAVFVAALPEARAMLRQDFDQEIAAVDALKAARDGAGDEAAAAALEPAIQRRQQVALDMLEDAVELLDMARARKAPTPGDQQWLVQRVSERARLASSHIGQSRAQLDDLAAQIEAGADPAAVQVAEGAARLRLDSASLNLEALIGQIDRLGLDASAYQRLLVESTGELTIDSIDRDVAGDLVSRWIEELREGLASNGPSFVFRALLFGLIVSAFWGLSRFVRQVVGRAVEAPHLRFSLLLKRMIVSLATSAVIVLGLLVAFSQLGIQVGPMLAGLGIAGFVLGFALQDTLGNFAAGIMILLYRPFDVEDMIDCAAGVFGKVSQMSLVSTTILTIDNKTLIVPNSKIWGDVITNVTAQAIRRVDLEFGIGYGDDIPKAEAILEAVLDEHPMVLDDPEPIVKLHTLGDSSVNFVVRPWCARDNYWDVQWDVTREVKLRFDREGVSIPFPQRDVHLYPTEPAAPTEPTTASPSIGSGGTPQSGQTEPENDED